MREEESREFSLSNGLIVTFCIVVAFFAVFFIVDISAKTFHEHTHTVTIEDKQYIHGNYRHRGSIRRYESYYVYGVREDGEHVKYELGTKFMFLNTAPESYYEQFEIGKKYQVTVTGLCFRNEILLNHIVKINNPEEVVEQRQKTGFVWQRFCIYAAVIWMFFAFIAGIITRGNLDKDKKKQEIQMLSVIAGIVTILLLIVSVTMW